jgi:DNA-binding GntR family transcriptional regulator
VLRSGTMRGVSLDPGILESGNSRIRAITADPVATNDLVAAAIRQEILEGKLRPRTRLVQDELAERLGVSRQPVREALRRLETEGLLSRTLSRGLIVREYSEADVRETYHLRRLLEGEAAAIAAPRLTDSDLLQIESIHERLCTSLAADRVSDLYILNRAFHRSIYVAAQMPQLLELIDRLWTGLTICTPLFVPGRAGHTVDEHWAIVQTLRRREAAKAANAVRTHIEQAEADYFAAVRRQRGTSGTA